jgi:hypothetical protein
VLLGALVLFGWLLLRPERADVTQATAPGSGVAATLAAGAERCQPVEALRAPGGKVVVGTSGSAAFAVRVRSATGVVASGGPVRGSGGEVTVPVTPALPAGEPLQVCVRNTGAAPLTLSGTSYALAVRVLAAKRESGLAALGGIRDRYTAARAGDADGGLLVAALLLAAVAGLGALVLLVRSAARA